MFLLHKNIWKVQMYSNINDYINDDDMNNDNNDTGNDNGDNNNDDDDDNNESKHSSNRVSQTSHGNLLALEYYWQSRQHCINKPHRW